MGPWIHCLLLSISCRRSWSLQSARANYKIAIGRRDTPLIGPQLCCSGEPLARLVCR
ncbi:MAG: hypothetical protein ACK56F_05715 [bacterium]